MKSSHGINVHSSVFIFTVSYQGTSFVLLQVTAAYECVLDAICSLQYSSHFHTPKENMWLILIEA